MKLENIKVVMVGTTHPGNIGAAARAMHNMCIGRLALVDPQCPVGEIAYARASGANAVLDRRETCADLAQAIADSHCVIALSARRRSLAWPEIGARELADKLFEMPENARAALVFGREQSGLTNEEVQSSHFMLSLPANPDFSSLNVAAAIQVVCYEVYSKYHAAPPARQVEESDFPAPGQEIEMFFEHLQRAMRDSGFLDSDHPGQIVQRLRRLFLRSEVTQNEINILRGMLSAFERPRR